jgi:hypothetical protein
MSMWGPFLADGSFERLRKMTKVPLILYGDGLPERTRMFVPITIGSTDYWADAVTGSLYHRASGEALSRAAYVRKAP